MSITEILQKIKETSGTNDKKDILEENKESILLRKALKYGLDPFTPFNVVKIPKVKSRLQFPLSVRSWLSFNALGLIISF